MRDFVTGVFMLLEDQYGVGDHRRPRRGHRRGGIRRACASPPCRDIDGTLWYVRNGEIARVGNMSQDYAVARIEVPVALNADLHEAEQAALRAAREAIKDETIAAKVIGEPEMLGVQTMSPDQVTLRLDGQDQAERAVVGAAPAAPGDPARLRRERHRPAAPAAAGTRRGGRRERVTLTSRRGPRPPARPGTWKNTLSMEPKSFTVPSLAPRSTNRPTMTSNASRDAACRPKWSSRPRPHIGVCRSGSALPSTGEDVQRGVRADPDVGHRLVAVLTVRVGRPDLGVEHAGVERFEAFDVLGDDRDVVDSVDQHGCSSDQGITGDGQVTHPHAGGVEDRVGHRRRGTDDTDLAGAARSHRVGVLVDIVERDRLDRGRHRHAN